MWRVHAAAPPALHQEEGVAKCMLKKNCEGQTGCSFWISPCVCVCLLSLALVLPQYSKHYIKAKIGDTITQAKCKCPQNRRLCTFSRDNVAELLWLICMLESLLSLSLN